MHALRKLTLDKLEKCVNEGLFPERDINKLLMSSNEVLFRYADI